MYFVYIDDSTNRPHHAFSALAVPHERWVETFEFIKKWRQHLKDVHQIPLNYELHATEFLSGRGSDQRLAHLPRHTRAQIFHKSFEVVDYMVKFGVRIPSKLGAWADGASTKNIPLTRILEDPQFKKSAGSYFIQTADFLAYGLLRREVPTAKARQRRIHLSFEQLGRSTVKECNPHDALGIIR